MFKVIYLPTAEFVEITEDRPEGYCDKEHRVRAYLDGHAVIYDYSTNEPRFVNTGFTHLKAREIPPHLLEVIEVPDV
jgi:hypothetical protein